MKIFLDTANVDAIKKLLSTGLIDGVTTNPTHLSKENKNPKELVLKICSLLPQGDISVEVTEKDPEDVYAQAKRIADLAGNIIVKIPCHSDYYSVIKRLVDEGVKLNITLVFTVVQGLMMSKLGVSYISPFVGRWDDNDVEGAEVLFQMRRMIDMYGFETEILAASLRHVRHVNYAIEAGCDAATLPVAVFEKAAAHVLTDRGIELFNADWEKLGISKFP